MNRAVLLSLSLALSPAGAHPADAATYNVVRPAADYATMSEAQRLAYVEARAKAIASRLSDGAPLAITPDAVRLVKQRVDTYAARTASSDDRPFRESLRSVLLRGEANAPRIRQAFEAEGVSPLLGLYIAMIESEFNDCLESPMGARGMFQFLPKTAERYGVDPARLCELEVAAPAAARYMRDRRAEFGSTALGSALAVLSYNQGKKNVETAAAHITGETPEAREVAFWSLLARPDGRGLNNFFVEEGSRYVPAFFAAAIVGENPEDFGVATRPLAKAE